MTHRQDAEKVLATWREVERDLERATPGSPEAEHLQTQAARMRDEYQAIVGAAMTPDPLEVLEDERTDPPSQSGRGLPATA